MSNQELIQKVDDSIESIRPYLHADGGDVRVVEVTDEGVAVLELLGACGSCAMSSMTMKAGIEEAIKKAVPEITSVEALNLTAPTDPHAKMPGQ